MLLYRLSRILCNIISILMETVVLGVLCICIFLPTTKVVNTSFLHYRISYFSRTKTGYFTMLNLSGFALKILWFILVIILLISYN